MRGPQLPAWALELVEGVPVGRLGMIDGRGRPRVLPVTFALAGAAVWSAVDHKPKRIPGYELARIRWLRRHPEATLLVDRYSDDWEELAWVQLIGKASIVEGIRSPEALVAKYRQYRELPPVGPFIRLDIGRTSFWRAAPASR